MLANPRRHALPQVPRWQLVAPLTDRLRQDVVLVERLVVGFAESSLLAHISQVVGPPGGQFRLTSSCSAACAAIAARDAVAISTYPARRRGCRQSLRAGTLRRRAARTPFERRAAAARSLPVSPC